MKQQICNNCERTLGLLEKGHLYEGKVVCGACIEVLDPPAPERKKAVIVGETNGRTASSGRSKEDVKYDRAKRKCVFFFASVIWLIQLILFFVFLAMIPMIFVLVSGLLWLFG